MNRYINILITILLSGQVFASAPDTLFLSAERLTRDYVVEISDSWSYHPGDDSVWASSTFDDSDWDTLKPMMWMNEYDIGDWKGIGWFRKVIKIDSSDTVSIDQQEKEEPNQNEQISLDEEPTGRDSIEQKIHNFLDFIE